LVVVRPTWTTRPRRPEELDGTLEHRFVSDRKFDELLRAGSFSQTGALTGLPYRYGLPAFEPRDGGPVDAVILRADYVEPFSRAVPGAFVYQIGSRGDQMVRRIRARGGGARDLDRRVADNITETTAGRRVADRTFTNDGALEDLVDSVAGAMAIDFAHRSGSAPAAVAS
jgi:guanylate kinase